MAAALVPNACLSVLSCTSSSASNIPSIPVADSSCVLSSSARRIPSGSDVVKPARPAPAVGSMVLLVAGFFLAPAFGAALLLVGLAASSAASKASRSAFFRAILNFSAVSVARSEHTGLGLLGRRYLRLRQAFSYAGSIRSTWTLSARLTAVFPLFSLLGFLHFGSCIRLFGLEDWVSRPRLTPPLRRKSHLVFRLFRATRLLFSITALVWRHLARSQVFAMRRRQV